MMPENRKSFEELDRELDIHRVYLSKIIFHRKTGGRYQVIDIFYKEDDLSVWFTYTPQGWRRLRFSRPISELTDGRYSFSEQ